MTRGARYDASAAVLIGNLDETVPNRFHLAALTFQRARQLQNGARPHLDAAGHKVARVALLEVMAGMVSWDVA